MARTEARIKTSIWKSAEWRALSLIAQWLYELLLSQADLSLCGVIGYMPARWAKMARGVTGPKVIAAVKELTSAGMVVHDEDTGEVWIRTFTKHDGVMNVPGSCYGMMKDFEGVLSDEIRGLILGQIPDGFVDALPDRFPKAFGNETKDGPRYLIPDEFADAIKNLSHVRAHSDFLSPTTDNRLPTTDSLASAKTADRRTRPPDEVWDALMAACGVSDITDSARGAYNRAKADLAGAGATPSEIHHRAGVFRRRWPEASLTPTALARRWPECAELPKRAQKPDAVDSVFGQLGAAR